MKTTLLLLLLTVTYFVIAIGITIGIAKWNKKDPWRYLGNNNTWWFVGVGMCAATFVIACFHFGPAVLLPEKHPTAETRATVGNFFSHLLHGKNAPAKSVPTTPLPWATGTWFWWKAELFYILLTFFYTFFAFSDEINRFWNKAKERAHKRHEEREQERKKKESQQPASNVAQTSSSDHNKGIPFSKLLWVELIAEVIGDLLAHIWKNRKGRSI